MYQIKQSEATAARRRIPILFVSSSDGFSPLTPTSPAAYISTNGGTFAATTNAVTLETLAAGQSATGCYYLELTAAEVATLGVINVNVQSTNCRQYNAVIQVMAYDAYAQTNLGLTALPAVATGSAGAIPTTGSGPNQIAVNGSGAISTVVSVTNGVTVTTNNDKTGYSLATAPPTAAQISTQVWSETLPGSFTATQAGNILNQGSATSIWAAATRTLTAGTNIILAKGTGITGFNDISAQSVWDVLAANVTAVNSIGVQLKTNIDAAISTRLASASYTTPPTTAAIATQVWSETLPGTYTATQAGFKLNAAGSAADPWATTLPGSYTAGTAGFIIGNRLDTNVGSRMATFTLPSNFSSLAITVGGAVTAGTVSDKTGYSLSTSQTFSTTGSVGSVTGSVASVTGSVGGNVNGSVGSVVGGVGGNITGSVGSVVGSVGSIADVSSVWNHLVTNINTTNSIGLQLKTNVDAQISTRLASSSYTAAPTVAQIWQQALPSTFTTGQAGYILGTNLDATISSRLASSSYTVPPTTTQINQALWNQVRATASPTGGIPAAGTFGFYIDKQLSTISGGSGGGVIIKQGPFKLSATNDMGQNNILDLVQNDARNIVLEVIDENEEPIPLSGTFTYTVNIYDISGTLSGSYAGTVDYANGGQVSFNITSTTTATKGTYYVVLNINDGTIDTKYGGLRLEVR